MQPSNQQLSSADDKVNVADRPTSDSGIRRPGQKIAVSLKKVLKDRIWIIVVLLVIAGLVWFVRWQTPKAVFTNTIGYLSCSHGGCYEANAWFNWAKVIRIAALLATLLLLMASVVTGARQYLYSKNLKDNTKAFTHNFLDTFIIFTVALILAGIIATDKAAAINCAPPNSEASALGATPVCSF